MNAKRSSKLNRVLDLAGGRRRMGGVSEKKISNMALAREREERFRQKMLASGVVLLKPYAPFRFQRSRYIPDWYSPKDDVYYEVLGSDGPSNRMPLILDLMAIFHPKVRLICVRPSGKVFMPVLILGERRYAAMAAWPFRDALLKRMTDEGMKYCDLASTVGLKHSTFSMMLHGHRRFPQIVLDRLESFAAGDGAIVRQPESVTA